MNINLEWVLATKQRTVTVLGGALIVLVAAVLIWYVLTSPLRGFVSGTVIAEDGSIRAVKISVKEVGLEYYSIPDAQVALVAAVPAPSGGATAYVTQTRDRQMHVSLSDGTRLGPTAISGESVSVPQWSSEGISVALSKRDSEEPGPEAWTVLRTVRQGDSLTVGKGVKPFPSPNQRTFALTSDGVALLSYSDNEPTIVIASPVPVPETTPFAVSQDGMRVAWVAPADKSLQVFENVNGYFVPLLLQNKSPFQTLVFAPDGRHLIGGSHSETTTSLSIVKISSGKTSVLGTIGGLLELHTWNYE